MSGWAGVREPLACVGFCFAHEIVGYVIPDLEKEIVILSMNRTNRNEARESSLVGNAAPMSANSRYGLARAWRARLRRAGHYDSVPSCHESPPDSAGSTSPPAAVAGGTSTTSVSDSVTVTSSLRRSLNPPASLRLTGRMIGHWHHCQ